MRIVSVTLLLAVVGVGRSSAFSFFTSSLLVRSVLMMKDNDKGVREDTPRHKIPIVICPGFGNDEIDYINPKNMGVDYGLVTSLTRRGFSPDLIKVLPIKRFEWLRVAGGLLDANFYTGSSTAEGLAYGWYVKRLRQTIEEMHGKSGGERCILLCHSAGGWLARACLGNGSWEAQTGSARVADYVRALISLGSVHKPPEGRAASFCATRGALASTEMRYPGAHLTSQGIKYVSVGGNSINVSDDSSPQPSSLTVRAVYRAVSGRDSGTLTGDGVVPLEWSFLDGSHSIVLDGVLHSIHDHGAAFCVDKWYGSENVVDRWLQEALTSAGIEAKKLKRKHSSLFRMKLVSITLKQTLTTLRVFSEHFEKSFAKKSETFSAQGMLSSSAEFF